MIYTGAGGVECGSKKGGEKGEEVVHGITVLMYVIMIKSYICPFY
jgi:hypothetical protein